MKISLNKLICLTGYILTLFEIGLSCMHRSESSSSSTSIAERRSDNDDRHSHISKKLVVGKVHQLNTGQELLALTPNLRAYRGEQIYGRLIVPWSRSQWKLTVSAFWTSRQYTTPLWIYLKAKSLPTSSDFDKSSITFVSRQFSRIRVEDAAPGDYYIMVEALVDLRNLTIGVSLMQNRRRDRHIFQEIEYRPDQESEWALPNDIVP